MTQLEKMIARHEGYRQYPYRCTAGKLTIGYGFNLDAGMSEEEAMLLLRYRIRIISAMLAQRLPWYSAITETRQQALIDMAYQLGVDGLLKFKKALAAMACEDWDAAAEELLDSKWARSDSPRRALEIAALIRCY